MSSRRGGRVGGIEWSIDLENRNRLSVKLYDADEIVDDLAVATTTTSLGGKTYGWREHPNEVHVSICFGNGNNDPVWAIYFNCWAPRWLARRAAG